MAGSLSVRPVPPIGPWRFHGKMKFRLEAVADEAGHRDAAVLDLGVRNQPTLGRRLLRRCRAGPSRDRVELLRERDHVLLVLRLGRRLPAEAGRLGEGRAVVRRAELVVEDAVEALLPHGIKHRGRLEVRGHVGDRGVHAALDGKRAHVDDLVAVGVELHANGGGLADRAKHGRIVHERAAHVCERRFMCER